MEKILWGSPESGLSQRRRPLQQEFSPRSELQQWVGRSVVQRQQQKNNVVQRQKSAVICVIMHIYMLNRSARTLLDKPFHVPTARNNKLELDEL